jgi:hypothetical protein
MSLFRSPISDVFDEQHEKLVSEQDQGADPEHPADS